MTLILNSDFHSYYSIHLKDGKLSQTFQEEVRPVLHIFFHDREKGKIGSITLRKPEKDFKRKLHPQSCHKTS